MSVDISSRKADMARSPYTLRDRDLLRKIMEHPGTGVPYTVRSLAKAAKCPHSTIGHLLSGEQTTTSTEYAHDIAEAVGVAVLVLFAPPASPNLDNPSHNHANPNGELT
jgi:hypothetical protein